MRIPSSRTQSLTTQSLTTQSLTTQSLTTQSLTTQSLTTQSLTTQSLDTQSSCDQSLDSRIPRDKRVDINHKLKKAFNDLESLIPIFEYSEDRDFVVISRRGPEKKCFNTAKTPYPDGCTSYYDSGIISFANLREGMVATYQKERIHDALFHNGYPVNGLNNLMPLLVPDMLFWPKNAYYLRLGIDSLKHSVPVFGVNDPTASFVAVHRTNEYVDCAQCLGTYQTGNLDIIDLDSQEAWSFDNAALHNIVYHKSPMPQELCDVLFLINPKLNFKSGAEKSLTQYLRECAAKEKSGIQSKRFIYA